MNVLTATTFTHGPRGPHMRVGEGFSMIKMSREVNYEIQIWLKVYLQWTNPTVSQRRPFYLLPKCSVCVFLRFSPPHTHTPERMLGKAAVTYINIQFLFDKSGHCLSISLGRKIMEGLPAPPFSFSHPPLPAEHQRKPDSSSEAGVSPPGWSRKRST